MNDSVSIAARRVAELSDLIRRKAAGEDVRTGVPSGIAALDAFSGGYSPGLLHVVGAGTGVGKSSFVLNTIKGPVAAGLPPAWVSSWEDPVDAWADRMLSSETGIPADQLRKLDVGPEVIPRLERAQKLISSSLIDPVPGQTIREAGERVWAHHKVSPISLWALDYAEAIRPGDGVKRGDERGHISNLVRFCVDFAHAAKIPVLLISQLNRDHETRGKDVLDRSKGKDYSGYIPMKHQLHGSSTLEKAAKFIILLHRPGLWDRSRQDDEMQLHVAKNNFGSDRQVISCLWDGPTTTIRG